jgi:hypothetical protein
MSQQTARLKTQLVRRVPLDKLKHVPPKHPPRDRSGFSSLLVARRAMGTRLKKRTGGAGLQTRSRIHGSALAGRGRPPQLAGFSSPLVARRAMGTP